jgi:hypothetical protein
MGYLANALLVLYVQVVDPSAGMGMGLGAAAAAPAAQAVRRPANMEAYVIGSSFFEVHLLSFLCGSLV